MINDNNNEIGVGVITNTVQELTYNMHKDQLKHFARIRHENRKKKFFLPHWIWDGSKINKMHFTDYIQWIYTMSIRMLKK